MASRPYEESQGADPQYGCCTFRGSVVALDAATGAVVWKTSMITDAPQRRGTSTAGVPLGGRRVRRVVGADHRRAARVALRGAPATSTALPPHRRATPGRARSAERYRSLDPADDAGRRLRVGLPAGQPELPELDGPDFDFGSPPMLTRPSAGRDLIVIGQKSGLGCALDPDNDGAIVWHIAPVGRHARWHRVGSAVDGELAYFAVSDITLPQPGGLHAVRLATGERVWRAAAGAVRDRPRVQRGPVGGGDGDRGCRFSGWLTAPCGCTPRRWRRCSGSSTRTASSRR